MESRFLAGARGLKLALIAAALVVLPVLAAWAAKPETVVNSKTTEQGFAVKEKGDGLEPTSKRAQLYPRSNYVWPYATGPVYGDVDAAQRNDAGVLHTRVGSFDLRRGMPAFPAELRGTNRLGQVPVQYFLLQVDPVAFGDGSFDRIRESITSQGGAIVEQMPVGGFVARLTAGAFDAIQAVPGVLALEPYHPAFKLSPMVGRVPMVDPVRAISDVYRLEAMVFQGEDATAVASQLARVGANVVGVNGDVITFEIHRTKLAQAASIEAISVVNEALPMLVKGEESSSTVQSGAGRDNTDATLRRQIDGVASVKSRPVTRRLPIPGPLVFGRGMEIVVRCDESAFEGAGGTTSRTGSRWTSGTWIIVPGLAGSSTSTVRRLSATIHSLLSPSSGPGTAAEKNHGPRPSFSSGVSLPSASTNLTLEMPS